MGIENRKYPRQEITLTVCIEASDGARTSCWLSDLSQTGARLAVGQAGTLPEQFMLLLSDEMQRWCRVVWRTGQEVGVCFETRSQGADRPPEQRPKRFVMITCPQTRRSISTGVRVHDANELGKLPNVRRFAQCPHCKVVHGWSLSEATI
jgi:PilZ domain-containing protein